MVNGLNLNSSIPLIPVMLVGDSLVGKTSFLGFFLFRKFHSFPSTVGVDYKEIKRVSSASIFCITNVLIQTRKNEIYCIFLPLQIVDRI